ncbi:MAG TPA: family 43 glycosylhydrolase [Kofleriaceae bacterium]|jgi:beta-xylosidase|nr:family 43 glycosylhydrolase [Kofleriaceae bacterium]
MLTSRHAFALSTALFATLPAALLACATVPSSPDDDDLPVVPAAATTSPVVASKDSFADPGVFLQGSTFYAFATGLGLLQATSGSAGGRWSTPADVFERSSVPAWVNLSKPVWAPDMIQAANGDYVVYFSAALNASAGTPPASEKPAGDARCIGSARSKNATGRFAIDPRPVVCLPGYGALDDMTADPADRQRGQGVIDASPRQVTSDNETQLFLVFKTQGPAPSTIRMLQLSNQNGSSVLVKSHQLVRSTGNTFNDTVEAPSLVQHGSWFVLFVAHGNWESCEYSTQWYKSQHIWSWSNAPTALLTHAGTKICGPGGADVTGSQVSGQNRIFLHGWIDKNGAAAGSPTGATRGLYAAVLTWGADGFTPHVGEFLTH